MSLSPVNDDPSLIDDVCQTSDVRLPLARWVALSVLLAVEVLGLTVGVDGRELIGSESVWASIVLQAHLLPAVAIATMVATLLLGWRRLRDTLMQVSAKGFGRYWHWLFAHLVAFAVFAALTVRVTDGTFRVSGNLALWVAGWIVSGLVVIGSWAAALVRPALWPALVSRCWGSLLAGVAVGTSAWSLGQLATAGWVPLARCTILVVRMMLELISADVVYQSDSLEVGIGSFTVVIAPTCSGYEGVGLLWVFLAAYLWVYRASFRFPHVLVMFPIGTAVMWLANVARIVALIVLGARVSPELAAGGFHSQAGWLAFNGVALGIVLLTRYLPSLAVLDREDATAHEKTVNPAAGYLVPLLVLVATSMVGSALTVGFDLTYPLRVVAVAAALWYYRRSLTEASWSFSLEAVAVGIAAFVVWMILEPHRPGSASNVALPSALAMLPWPWAQFWLVLRVIGSVVTVPIAEELAFRGYLTRRLITADFLSIPPGRFTLFSFLVSSGLFGVLHERWLAGGMAGALYALAYYRRGRISDPIVAHATTNALIAVCVLATGQWSLWT